MQHLLPIGIEWRPSEDMQQKSHTAGGSAGVKCMEAGWAKSRGEGLGGLGGVGGGVNHQQLALLALASCRKEG